MHAYSGRTDIVMITTHPPPRVYAEYEVAIHQQASAYQPSIGLAIKATGAPPCRRSATNLHFDAWSWSAPSVECENDKCSFESIYQSTANPKKKHFDVLNILGFHFESRAHSKLVWKCYVGVCQHEVDFDWAHALSPFACHQSRHNPITLLHIKYRDIKALRGFPLPRIV